MSRLSTFFILGTIMAVLAVIVAFEFDISFSGYQDEGQKVSGVVSHSTDTVDAAYFNANDFENNVQDNTVDPFIPPVNKNISENVHHGNSKNTKDMPHTEQEEKTNQVSAKDHNQSNAKNYDEQDEINDDTIKNDKAASNENVFVWITEAPTNLKPQEKAITKTRTSIEASQFSFQMTGSESFKTRTMLLKNPDRYVLDVYGKWGIVLPPVPENNPWLKKIRIGSMDGYTRFVFELAKTPTYTDIKEIDTNKIEIIVR